MVNKSISYIISFPSFAPSDIKILLTVNITIKNIRVTKTISEINLVKWRLISSFLFLFSIFCFLFLHKVTIMHIIHKRFIANKSTENNNANICPIIEQNNIKKINKNFVVNKNMNMGTINLVEVALDWKILKNLYLQYTKG